MREPPATSPAASLEGRPVGDGPVVAGAVPARRDPAGLPLFGPVAPRPGRARSTFTLTPDATRPGVAPHHGGSVDPAVSVPAVHVTDQGRIDWALVAAFRSQASEQLSAALGGDRARMSRAAQHELGRAIILELLQTEVAEAVSAGRDPWLPTHHRDLAEAVFHALFGLGRLQPLVDDDRIENVIITGHDTVWLEDTDGSLVRGPPVADSDEELIDFLVFLASRSEVNARPFSHAQPRLHLRLDGGARLAAAAWVTPRPSVVIRRHRLRRVTLGDLVGRGALSPVAASFLAAAVKAGKTIVVAGPQGAGKTTMVRALCAEIPRHEAIGTFETEYELHLHEMPDQHPIVHAWESRPGSGERGPDGRQAGEFTLDEALVDSFRFNLSRQIVGEVRGREVLAMIKAMESSSGSISTTHASTAEGALRKLVTCAMEAGAHVTHEYATSQVAENIDLVVQLHLSTTPQPDGSARRARWVSEIIAVGPGERPKGYEVTHVFRSVPPHPVGHLNGPVPRGGPVPVGGPGLLGVAVPGVLPDAYRALQAYGFDLRGYLAATSSVTA